MKVKTIIINNYRDFRLVFESDAEALPVMETLRKAIEEDLKRDETAHVILSRLKSRSIRDTTELFPLQPVTAS